MIWAYILIGGFTGLIVGLATRPLVKDKKDQNIANKISLIAVILSLSITKWYGAPYYYAYTFENSIKNKYPLFELLSTASPDAFSNYIKKIKQSILEDDQAKIEIYTSEFIGSEFLQYAVHATNQSIYKYVKVTTDFYKSIYMVNPNLVVYLEFSNTFMLNKPIYNSDQLNEKNLKDILSAKAGVIESAIKTPQPNLSTADVQRARLILDHIYQNLIAKYGNENVKITFQHPSDQKLDKKIAAEIIISLYQALVEQGVDNAALVLKYLLTP